METERSELMKRKPDIEKILFCILMITASIALIALSGFAVIALIKSM